MRVILFLDLMRCGVESRQAELVRKGILVTAAVVLLAGTSLPKRGTAAPAPAVPKAAPSGSGLVLPPPPVPEFGSVVDLPPTPAPAPAARPTAPAKQKSVIPAQPPATSVAKPRVNVVPPAMVKVPAPVVVRPRVTIPAPPLPAAAPPVAVTVAPPVTEKEWKVLIRPEFYKANDPWEYVRTGEVSWGSAASAAQRSAGAVATGDMAPPAMAGSHGPVTTASGTSCGSSPYKHAYAEVPFSRAEYEANPSYRHDAAMELMFGTLRPTTIMKQNQPYFSRYPDMFRYRHTIYPYQAPGSNSVDVNYYWNYPGYW